MQCSLSKDEICKLLSSFLALLNSNRLEAAACYLSGASPEWEAFSHLLLLSCNALPVRCEHTEKEQDEAWNEMISSEYHLARVSAEDLRVIGFPYRHRENSSLIELPKLPPQLSPDKVCRSLHLVLEEYRVNTLCTQYVFPLTTLLCSLGNISNLILQ